MYRKTLMSKKPYLPNNIKELQEAPDEAFQTITYGEFMDWKIGGWILPSSVCCLIRAVNIDGKVKEYTYQKWSAASKKIESLIESGEVNEVTVCDEEGIQLIRKEDFNEEE